jgi:hypothetical protein
MEIAGPILRPRDGEDRANRRAQTCEKKDGGKKAGVVGSEPGRDAGTHRRMRRSESGKGKRRDGGDVTREWGTGADAWKTHGRRAPNAERDQERQAKIKDRPAMRRLLFVSPRRHSILHP